MTGTKLKVHPGRGTHVTGSWRAGVLTVRAAGELRLVGQLLPQLKAQATYRTSTDNSNTPAYPVPTPSRPGGRTVQLLSEMLVPGAPRGGAGSNGMPGAYTYMYIGGCLGLQRSPNHDWPPRPLEHGRPVPLPRATPLKALALAQIHQQWQYCIQCHAHANRPRTAIHAITGQVS